MGGQRTEFRERLPNLYPTAFERVFLAGHLDRVRRESVTISQCPPTLAVNADPNDSCDWPRFLSRRLEASEKWHQPEKTLNFLVGGMGYEATPVALETEKNIAGFKSESRPRYESSIFHLGATPTFKTSVIQNFFLPYPEKGPKYLAKSQSPPVLNSCFPSTIRILQSASISTCTAIYAVVLTRRY